MSRKETAIYYGIIGGFWLFMVFILANVFLPDSYDFSFNLGPLFVWVRW